MDRRSFLHLAAAGAGGLALNACNPQANIRKGSIVTGRPLNIACVGIGGKGRSDVNGVTSENIVALCDVDLIKAQTIINQFPDVPLYRDFRKMLIDLDDQIDAVMVSTPDHMHFPIAMMAIEMGKHVFVQKPLAHTIEEARLLTQAAERHQVATQMGIQGNSMSGIRKMREWHKARVIGEVEEVHIWTNRPIWPQGITQALPAEKIPHTLDWNLWLGVAQERAYNSDYAPFKWRGWWDFGCGALGDIGCHAFDCAFSVLGLGAPSKVEAESDQVNEHTAPLWSKVVYHFPATAERGPVKLYWYDGDLAPDRPKELEANRNLPGGIGGQLWYGTEGTIMVSDVYCRTAQIIPREKMIKLLKAKNPPETETPSIGHYEEWIEACKGGVPAGANFNYAGPLTELVLLGNLAIRTGQTIEWDPIKMKSTNVQEANQYVQKIYRTF